MTPQTGLLSNKKILVTGGSRGLGRAFCEAFAKEGAWVAFTYSRDEEGARETEAVFQKSQNHPHYLSFRASVSDPTAMKDVVRKIKENWGELDVLVNNAGISEPLPLALMDEADWDRLIDTNLKGTYVASRAVLSCFVHQKKGLILNIGSLAGVRMIEAPVHYCASKAAIKGFTEALSKEVSRYGIRVLCLAPGLLEEGVANNLPTYKLEDYLKHISLHRVGKLEEVARFAAFLVSDRNTYMNGATVLMDGGF